MDDIDRFLKEDLGEDGDITSDSLFNDETAEAKIIAKEDCIFAGLKESQTVFEKTGAEIKYLVKDGDFIQRGKVIATIKGSARSILKGERLALNIIGRMTARSETSFSRQDALSAFGKAGPNSG